MNSTALTNRLKNFVMNNFKFGVFCLLLALSSSPVMAEEGHDEAEGSPNDNVAELTDEQIQTAGIETIRVQWSEVADILIAPGEVTLNAYETIKVTPRIEAQIVERHVRLGESVEKGQPLVTLSSIEVAQAQGELLVTDREWVRVEELGRKIVSDRRFVESQVARQQAYARVRAYGMTEDQTQALLRQGDPSKATGELTLLSPQNGTVIHEDFIVGELAQAGRELFVVTDESTLWVNARLTPEKANNVSVGSSARIKVNEGWLDGEVIQLQHALDETTRTLSVRVQAANPNDQLHPGQFVSVEIESSGTSGGIAVPVAAVLRSPDGDWQVYVEEAPGRYTPKEVEMIRTVGERMVVEGLEDGELVVSKGAFFIQSEIAKGGFDIHNH